MRVIAVLAVSMMLLAAKLTPIHAQGGRDRDDIQGSWTVSTGEKAGRKAPTDGLKDVRMTFSGSKFTWKAGGTETEGTFSLDITKMPKEISMTAKDKKLAGVYKLEGDELQICVGIGDDRPTDFVVKADAKALVLVLKREKP